MLITIAYSIKLRKTVYVFEKCFTNTIEKSPMKEVQKLKTNKTMTRVMNPEAAPFISGGLNVM